METSTEQRRWAGTGGTWAPGRSFKLAKNGELTTLYRFCTQRNCPDGANPTGLVQATDGILYGTTYGDGNNFYGTVFKITPSGDLTTLYKFADTDGALPNKLVQATNGNLYGTTRQGGASGLGTIFGLDVGLGRFVSLVRDSGKVGDTDGVFGQGFAGTTSVVFNGTPANFKVLSDTLIRDAIPAGATTGYVTVTTPSATLTTDKPFRVTPRLLNFNPPSGPVGTQVTITGVSLTQTQRVGFGDHVSAQFTVNSDTQVTAIVPSGAKTGPIGIETRGGITISAGTFTVTP